MEDKRLRDIYQLDFGASKIDTSLRHISGLDHVVVVGVVQQRFGRNASYVKAGPAQSGVLLYAHGLKRGMYLVRCTSYFRIRSNYTYMGYIKVKKFLVKQLLNL